jgi:hypothetical protein
MGGSGVAGRVAGELATTRAGLSQRCCRWVRSSGCLLWAVVCGAGHPITYQRDITLIGGLSMVAVLTGRLGGPRVGEGDLPGGGALVLADQVRARVDERQVREGPGGSSQGASRCAVLSPGRTAAAGWRRSAASRTAPWARLTSPIPVSAETRQNERIVNVPSSPGRLINLITIAACGNDLSRCADDVGGVGQLCAGGTTARWGWVGRSDAWVWFHGWGRTGAPLAGFARVAGGRRSRRR